VSQRSIFRQRAIEAYQRGLEKDVVPQLITWPIAVSFWLLLGIIAAVVALAWYIEIPVYQGAAGIIPSSIDATQAAGADGVAVLFLRSGEADKVRVGQAADLQIGSTSQTVTGTIAAVEPGPLSPAAIRSRYRLDDAEASLVTESSSVVVIHLNPELSVSSYAGSRVTARIATDSQRLLSLLPGFGRYLAEGGG